MTTETEDTQATGLSCTVPMEAARYAVDQAVKNLSGPLSTEFKDEIAAYLMAGTIKVEILEDLLKDISYEVENAAERHCIEAQQDGAGDFMFECYRDSMAELA